ADPFERVDVVVGSIDVRIRVGRPGSFGVLGRRDRLVGLLGDRTRRTARVAARRSGLVGGTVAVSHVDGFRFVVLGFVARVHLAFVGLVAHLVFEFLVVGRA